jgi:hypothetical protein
MQSHFKATTCFHCWQTAAQFCFTDDVKPQINSYQKGVYCRRFRGARANPLLISGLLPEPFVITSIKYRYTYIHISVHLACPYFRTVVSEVGCAHYGSEHDDPWGCRKKNHVDLAPTQCTHINMFLYICMYIRNLYKATKLGTQYLGI